MSGRGGNQRPLTSPDGRDLQYARLLFDALWSRTSKSGRRFAKDHDILYQRWLRLARVIIRNNGGATPFGSLGDTDRVLDLLELPDDRNSGYPSLRDLNDEELASLKWQRAIASEALDEIYIDLGQPLDQRDALASESESWKIYDDASSFLLRWGILQCSSPIPLGTHRGWGTGDGGGVVAGASRSYPWAIGFFFGNVELSMESWTVIAGISGLDD